MAEGFVVAERNEETGDAIAFWNGATLGEDMQAAVLADTKEDARMLFGSLQSQYPEKEMVIMPARTVVELAAAPRTRATV